MGGAGASSRATPVSVSGLRAALLRNVYRGAEVAQPKLDALSTYVRAAHEALKAASDSDLVAGTFAWPAP